MLRQVLKTKSFELTLWPRRRTELESAVLEAGCVIRPSAMAVGRRMPIVEREITEQYIMISAMDLGLKASAQRLAIYDLARRDGLAYRSVILKPVGRSWIANKGLRLPIRELLIGSTPIEMSRDFFLLLEIRDGQTMNTDAGGEVVCFSERREWLFRVA